MGWIKSLFVFLLSLSIFCFANGMEASELDSNTIKAAIDITNISNETQTTNIILEGLASDDFDKVTLDKIDSSFSTREKGIREEFKKIESQDLSNVSKSSLDALQSTWSLNQAEIEKGTKQIRELFVETNSDLEALRAQRVNWQATLSVMSTTESPVEMVNNIEGIIKQIDVAETRLNENLSRLVLFETKINELNGLALKVEEAIQKALEDRSKDVFKQNAPVIWRIFLSSSDTLHSDSSSIETNEKDSLAQADTKLVHWSGEKIRLSVEFMESNQETIYLHLFLWFITVMLSMRLGKKDIQMQESDENLTFAARSMFDVRHHLIFSATYISILYATFLYDFIPLLIAEVLVILLLIINVVIHGKRKGQGVIKIALFFGGSIFNRTNEY